MDTLDLRNAMDRSKSEAEKIMEKMRELRKRRRSTQDLDARFEIKKQLSKLSNDWMKAMAKHKAAFDEL